MKKFAAIAAMVVAACFTVDTWDGGQPVEGQMLDTYRVEIQA